MLMAHEVMESNTTASRRRKELREILRDAKGHVTDAARFDFMRALQDQQGKMADRKRKKAAAKMQSAPSVPAGAKVIPIRRVVADGEET